MNEKKYIKGKHSIVIHGKKWVKKIFANRGLQANFLKEVKALNVLKKYKFVPKIISYDEKKLVIKMEKIEGENFQNILKKIEKLPQRIKEKIIWEIFEIIFRICFILDLEGIYKDEWNRPFKHIVFTKDYVKIIDFDRTVFFSNKSNLTQFVSFVINFFGGFKDDEEKKVFIEFCKFYKECLNFYKNL